MDMFSKKITPKTSQTQYLFKTPCKGQFHPRLMTVIMFDAGQLCCASQASVFEWVWPFIWSSSQSSELSTRCSHNHNYSPTLNVLGGCLEAVAALQQEGHSCAAQINRHIKKHSKYILLQQQKELGKWFDNLCIWLRLNMQASLDVPSFIIKKCYVYD